MATKIKLKKVYCQRFRDAWLEDPDFRVWLVKIVGDPMKCRCKYCGCVLTAKLNDLRHHAKTKKHKKALVCSLS